MSSSTRVDLDNLHLLFRDFGKIRFVQDEDARLGCENIKLMVPPTKRDLKYVRTWCAWQQKPTRASWTSKTQSQFFRFAWISFRP